MKTNEADKRPGVDVSYRVGSCSTGATNMKFKEIMVQVRDDFITLHKKGTEDLCVWPNQQSRPFDVELANTFSLFFGNGYQRTMEDN